MNASPRGSTPSTAPVKMAGCRAVGHHQVGRAQAGDHLAAQA